MNYVDQHPNYQIKTTEQALSFVREQIDAARQTRLSCDVQLPGGPNETAAFQKQQYRKLLMRQFSALGALTALHRVGLIEDVAYMRLRGELMALLAPKGVGDARDAANSGHSRPRS